MLFVKWIGQSQIVKHHLKRAKTQRAKDYNITARYLANAQYRMRLGEHGSREEDVVARHQIHYDSQDAYVMKQCIAGSDPVKTDEHPEFPPALQDWHDSYKQWLCANPQKPQHQTKRWTWKTWDRKDKDIDDK